MRGKWTQGPWKTSCDGITNIIYVDDESAFEMKRLIGMFFLDCENREEELANQRLAAEAPMMIELIRMCYDHLNGMPVTGISLKHYLKNMIERVYKVPIDKVLEDA